MEFIQYVELLSFNFQFLGKIGTKYEVVWFHRWKFWKPENGHHIPKKHSNKSEIPCTRRRKPDRRWRPWMWRPRWAWRWGWPWCPTWRTWWSTGWPRRRGPWCSRRPRGRWSPGWGCWCWSASGSAGGSWKRKGLLFLLDYPEAWNLRETRRGEGGALRLTIQWNVFILLLHFNLSTIV